MRLFAVALLSACTAGPSIVGRPAPIPDLPFVLDAEQVDLSAVEDETDVPLFLDLFGTPVTVRPRRVSRRSNGIVWEGTGDGGVTATFVRHGIAWAGTLRDGERLIRFGMDGGTPVATLVDEAAMPVELAPVPVHSQGSFDLPGTSPRERATRADVLVAYTREALEGIGGLSDLRALIGLATTETNQGLSASGIAHEIRVVHTAEVSGRERGSRWMEMLDKLKEDGDGFADEVHTLRDTYGADHVVLLVDESSACGIAYVMTEVGPVFADSAFAVVSTRCATGYYSFAHEIGHNMGSAHHKSYEEEAAYPWSYGHQDPDATFRTLMAYACPGGCPRLNRWSDPAARVDGLPLGVSGTGMDAANNVWTLDDVRQTVAAFRPTTVSGPVPATLTAPTGPVIEGGVATVHWQGADGIPIRVTAGATPGAADFADVTAAAPPLIVSGLPVDGTGVWIRLWTPTDAGWSTEDTRFDTGAARLPSWVVPGPDGILTPDGAVLAWADADRPRYRVAVGTRPGTADVLDVVTTRNALEARSLPPGPVYLALGWEEGEAWRWAETTATVVP